MLRYRTQPAPISQRWPHPPRLPHTARLPGGEQACPLRISWRGILVTLVMCLALLALCPASTPGIEGSKTLYFPVDHLSCWRLGTIQDDEGSIGYCMDQPKTAPASPDSGGTVYTSFEYATGSWAYLAEHAYPYTTTIAGYDLSAEHAQTATTIACWMLQGDCTLEGEYFSPSMQRWTSFVDLAETLGYGSEGKTIVAAAAALASEAQSHPDWPQNNAQIWSQGTKLQRVLVLSPNVTVTFTKTSAQASTTIGNSSYQLQGAEYDIFRAEGDIYAAHIVTDENGRAQLSLAPQTAYYAVETKAPAGFRLSTERVNFTTSNQAGSISLSDEPVTATLRITKADASGAVQPGLSLAGAEFTVSYARDGATESKTITTDKNGTATITDLPLGRITIRETKAPAGYRLNSQPITLDARADQASDAGVVELSPAESVRELPIAFDVEIAKYLGDGTSDTSRLEHAGAGVTFDLISNSSGKTVGSIVTNENGIADTAGSNLWFGAGARPDGVSGALPYDPKGYTVRERADTVPDGFKHVDDWTIPADQLVDGAKLQYIVSNQRLTSRLQVVKKDAATGATVPLSGFSFQVLDKDKKPVEQETWYPAHERLSTFTTDDTGTVTLPEPLETGTYYLREVAAAAPYLTGADKKFTVSAEDAAGTDPLTVITYSDEQARGKATILKRDAATGSALKGAVFEVVAQEDIVAPDGAVQAAQGEAVARITTGKDGTAQVTDLPLGSGKARYAFVERTAPAGYVLDATPHAFTLSYQDSEMPVVTAHVDVENQPVRVHIDKRVLGSDEALPNTTFELWQSDAAAEKLETGENVTQASDDREVIATSATDKEGALTWERLTPGTYFFHETEAAPGFVRDTAIRSFNVDEKGIVHGDGFDEGNRITLENDFTRIDISKRDITNEEEVPGATLSILDENGNTLETWVSGTEPHRIERLSPGTYTLVEKITPQSYDEGNAVEFTVEETGEVQPVTFYDEPIEITGEVDKRQEIADPVADNVAPNGDNANTAAVTVSDEGRFDYAIDFRSTSDTWVDEFTVTDTIDAAAQDIAVLESVTTPQAYEDYDGLMNVWYTTDKADASFTDTSGANATASDGHENPWVNGERQLDYSGWVLWKADVPATEAQTLSVSDLGLPDGTRITGLRFEYGRVEAGFTSRLENWERDDLKDPHDDEDDIALTHPETFTVESSVGESVPVATPLSYAPAVLHMRATDRYVAGIKLENNARVDLYRNGGGDKLEDHDEDRVEQMAGTDVAPLFKTGGAPVAAGAVALLVVGTMVWLSQPRRR